MFRRQGNFFSGRWAHTVLEASAALPMKTPLQFSARFVSQTKRQGYIEMRFRPEQGAPQSFSTPTFSMTSLRRVAPFGTVPFGVGLHSAQIRNFHTTSSLRSVNRRPDALEHAKNIQHRPPDEEKKEEGGAGEEEGEESKGSEGYLPFPAPFHTINIISILFLANVILYLMMNWICGDEWKEWIVDHFTVSRENWHLIYPLFTSSFYQEHLLQLAIDCWLLWQFGNTVLDFLGAARLFTFWAMCSLGGSLIHVGRQYFELHYGLDPLEVRGRCFGPNPFILGLVAVEGLIFRHLNFMQSPPVPFLVLTAFVMVIDVWRVFTTKPEEHGASTGGALVAYLFWVMPTRFYGLDRLTAAM